jgi:uncharacterized protein (DUF433 family)
MSTSTKDRITRTPGVCGGKACIAGHRVRLLDIVVLHEHQGMTADEIVSHVPTITLTDVHAALGYYFEHIEEVREEMRADRALPRSSAVETRPCSKRNYAWNASKKRPDRRRFVFIWTNTYQPGWRLAYGGETST